MCKLCKPFYEIDPHMRGMAASRAAFAADNFQLANATEDLVGGLEDTSSPRGAEPEGEPGSATSPSAPQCLPDPPLPSPTAPRTHPLESSERTEESRSRLRRTHRTPSRRPRRQRFEASLEAISQPEDPATRDFLAFLREKTDKELVFAQQKAAADQQKAAADQQKAEADTLLARVAAVKEKIAVMAQLKEEMGFSPEQCMAFLRENGL